MTALAVSLAAIALACPAAQAQIAYSISNRTTLIRFNVLTPNLVTTIGTFSGATTGLDGLDFRIANGLLYGYDYSTDNIVTVNLTTAATAFVSTSTGVTSTNLLGIDFNPMADRLRLVNRDDQNFRINVDTGAAITDGTLAYAAGDVNAGVSPNLVDAAYTNNIVGTGSTTLYYIDYVTDTLVTTTNPNGGTLNTVGSLGIDTTDLVGFDIYTTAPNVNTAYATLTTAAGVAGLYTINLQTGAAALRGTVNSTGVYGLALLPGSAPAAAPEPGSIALLGLGALPLTGLVLRRRKARV